MILPATIAAVLAALAAACVWASQHGLTPRTTRKPAPQDGEPP